MIEDEAQWQITCLVQLVLSLMLQEKGRKNTVIIMLGGVRVSCIYITIIFS